MKVKELIAALQLCDQELEVYGYCDHGQTPEKVCGPSVIAAFCLDNSLDEYVCESDILDDNNYEYFKKAVLL